MPPADALPADDAPAPGHCFVTGCPRSGTSALTRLLNAHPAVVIGEERYRRLVETLATERRLGDFGPELFTPERLLDVREEESGYRPGQMADQFDRAHGRFARGQVRWVGDKLIPPTRKLVDAWADRFDGARVVFITRDPLAVAGSFQRRAQDPDDAWDEAGTYRRAPHVWRQSIIGLDHAVRRLGPERVHIVAYEDLFGGDEAHVRALFAFLDLDPSRALQRWRRSCERATIGAPSGLTPEQEAWVLRHLSRPGRRRLWMDPRRRLTALRAATAR